MTKTTAAPQHDLTALTQRRLSALLEATLCEAEAWAAEDDGAKVKKRADAITALAKAAAAIARLSPAPSQPLTAETVEPQSPPRPPPTGVRRAKAQASTLKSSPPENETPMNDQHPLDPAELDALREAAFARLDRLARLLEQKSEAECAERGDPDPTGGELDAERPSGAVAAHGG